MKHSAVTVAFWTNWLATTCHPKLPLFRLRKRHRSLCLKQQHLMAQLRLTKSAMKKTARIILWTTDLLFCQAVVYRSPVMEQHMPHSTLLHQTSLLRSSSPQHLPRMVTRVSTLHRLKAVIPCISAILLCWTSCCHLPDISYNCCYTLLHILTCDMLHAHRSSDYTCSCPAPNIGCCISCVTATYNCNCAAWQTVLWCAADSLQKQLGGAFSLLQNMGKAGQVSMCTKITITKIVPHCYIVLTLLYLREADCLTAVYGCALHV